MTTTTLRPLSESRARWLHQELADWERSGLVEHDQAIAIARRYTDSPTIGRRLSLGRLLLGLGASFVGIGIIWLVASNLDQLSPLLRFGVVAGFWLLFLLGGEALAARSVSAPIVGAARLLTALTFGATIFQAAQSLQVPAYSPLLLGVWAAGTLVHAYLTTSTLPLLVSIAAGIQWYVMELSQAEISTTTWLVALGVLSVLAVSLAVLHDRASPRFSAIWRTVGVALGLGTLFAAAVPGFYVPTIDPNPYLIGAGIAALIALVLAVVRTSGRARLEPLAALAVLGTSVALAFWETGNSTTQIGLADWLHAIVSVGFYVVVAVAVAALGTLRNNPVLTWMAMLALVVFATFQSFAVFAAIVQGAWLFVVLGLIFLGTGFLFDRARRELASSLDTRSKTSAATGTDR